MSSRTSFSPVIDCDTFIRLFHGDEIPHKHLSICRSNNSFPHFSSTNYYFQHRELEKDKRKHRKSCLLSTSEDIIDKHNKAHEASKLLLSEFIATSKKLSIANVNKKIVDQAIALSKDAPHMKPLDLISVATAIVLKEELAVVDGGKYGGVKHLMPKLQVWTKVPPSKFERLTGH